MHTHLSRDDRAIIGIMLEQNCALWQIADRIGCCRSTIWRELKRRRPGRAYDPLAAHRDAEKKRRQASSVPRKMTPAIWRAFLRKMDEYGSLLSAAHELPVGKTTLYNWTWKDAAAGSHSSPPRPRREAKSRLPHKLMSFGVGRYKKRRSAKLAAMWAATPICERPDIVNRRGRFGDIETDTMDWSAHGKSLTILDVKSGRVWLDALPTYSADAVAKVINRRLRGLSVKTITSDRGSEYARYRGVEAKQGAKWYVGDAGCPWQRGAVEQMNGLVRRMAQSEIAEYGLAKALRRAQKRINHRPTPRLKFRSPAQVLRL